MDFETDEERIARAARSIRGEQSIRKGTSPDAAPPPILRDERGRVMDPSEAARSWNYTGLTPSEPQEKSDNIFGGSIAGSDGLSLSGILDTVKEQWSSASRNAVWRNLLGDPAGEEERAHKVGTALGLNPQELMDNPDLMKQATLTYEGQRNRDFLQGRPFTPQTLSALYPEVDPTDTVAASMALKDYNNLMASRRTIDEYSLQAGNSLARAWKAGLRDYDASMLMGEAMNGTKSMDEAGRGIYAIGKEQEAYENTERGVFESIAGGTVRNLANMYKSTLDGMKQLVGQLGPQTVPVLQQIRNLAMPLGASAGAAMGAAGIAGAGVPLAVGGAAAGLGIMALSTFLGSYKQQAAQNFWRMATKKNDNGTPMYTREEAIRRARTQAFYQAGLEMIGTEIAVFGPIAKVFGKETARQLIQNTAARNALLTAGRAALRKDAAKAFGKQFAKGASAELLEEGLQQAVSDVDERLFGNETMDGGKILWNAVDAMVQAAPAVIGMVLPGAAAGAARRYRSMATLTAPELHDAVEEYKRENEAAMTQKLLESREQSQVYVKDKDVYGSIIQKQMERAGQGTMYLDVSSAVETPEGQAAVNELIQKGVVTAKEVTDAVESHGALEIAPGTYMQEVTPEAAETLAQHASYDAGGRTLAEIKAARKRMQDMRDIISETREEREAKAVKDLLDRDFPQGGEKRAVMEEVLSDDIHDVKGSLNRAIQTTKDQLAALTGADEKIQYLQEKQKNGSQDVGLITYVGDSGQYESRRVSGNEGWYSEFYKNNKKAPTQRDAYEIAYRETMEEISHSDDPEAAEAGKEIEALHSKLETLEELTDYVGKLDQDDLITKSQMSEDAYKTIYTPAVRALSHGSPNVAKAAKDSALLYAKMADALHEAYQLPYEEIAKIQIGGRPGSGYSQYMSPEDQLAIDEKHFADMIDRFMSGEEMSGAIRVMRTPIVMKLVGADILPVEISIANMKKILQVKHQKGMSPQIMKQIPRALSDPLFIANSYGNRKVVALDLKDETGAGVIVALELGRKGTEYTVNSIRSIYGKTKKKTDTPDWEWLANQFTEYHTVEYVNKRKTINWIHNEKLETLLPYESIDGFFTSIKANEEDLVKLKQENPTYYQMAGVRAENAPMERLAEAKAMWESMKPEEEIFRKTGWIRKKDGKWRWEIPDNLEGIHLEALLKNPGKKIRLEELYDNPKLYEAYPFLKNIPVYTFQGKEAEEYNGTTKRTEDRQIEIGVREKGLRDDPKEARSTLVHEIQHVIQFYEGFAVGGNPHSVQRQIRGEKESSEAFIKEVPYAEEWLKYDSMASDLAFRALENPLLETDANAAQERADELEKKIPQDMKRQLLDAQYRIEQAEDILRETNKKDFDLYMNLHGEIEARDTAARAEREVQGQADHIPDSMVHDPNAIVVFGSLYVPYSTGKTYYQSNAVYGGQYSETENVIRVFDGGNMSTVVHESAHFWLSTMERVIREKAEERGIEGNLDEVLAAMKDRKDVPARLVKDMETIRSWAKYSPEHLAEYTGTILEKEFAKHAKSVLSGEAGAEERFIQERFARGFEQYLMTGRAPSKDLRGSFRRFKEWLTELYKTVKNLGVKPPQEVRRIFDKMVATQEEINSWSAERRLTQTDMKLDYTKTEQEQIAAWAEEIKERAKEKCLADFIEKTKADAQKLLDESIKEQREEWKRQLVAENPLYQMEVTRSLQVKKSDWTNYLESQGFDEKTFAEALQKAGGTLEARLAAMEADARKQYEESVMTPEMMRSAAEAQLAGPEGRAALAEMEAAMLKRRIDKYIRTAALSAMELDRAEDPVKLAYEIKKRNGLLTEADEKARKEAEAKERNKAEKGALRERAMAAEESRRALQEQLQSLIQGLKAARDGLKYDRRRLRQEAEWALSDEKISKATNWKWWDNKAQSASRRGRDAIRRNDWNGAAQEKLNELHFSMMARVAKEYQDNIQKTLHGNPKIASPTDKDGAERYGILGLLNRIGRKENPLRMTEMSRYFVQHMAYQMGLSTKDGIQPVNHEGRPIPFTWAALAMELNPTQAMTADQAGGVYLGDDVIAPWLKTLFESDQKTIMSTMTYDHFMAAAKAMQIAYRVGRREYEGNTLRLHGKPVSFMEAAMALILTKWDHSKHDPKREKLTDNTLQRIAKKLGKAVDDLTLPEILFERLGPEWYELFYQTIDTASTKERTMMEAANTAMMENINRYTRKEWQSIRNDKKYTYGLDSHGMPIRYTKEQVLSMALNWGNDTNRARLLETVGGTRDELEAFIMDTLDDKDWDFVEGVWNHINSYWDDRNRVQKNLYGVPLGKVAGTTFTLPSGREIHGQYYPIKYDEETAVSTAERSVNEIIQQQMAGVSTFGLGMGSTKSRAGASGGQNVRLDLEVYLSHVAEAVHHIAMREASVDVYKLITMAPVKDALVERLGVDTYSILKQWAADQWHSPIDRMSSWEKMLGTLRKNMTFAAMAYRASTALLNIANILPLMERMGPMRALRAVGEMYFGGAYREQRKFVMEKSSYMRGRQVNMDRDLAREKKLPVDKHTWKATAMAQGLSDKVNAFGYAAIVETDFLFSLPQWTAIYKDSVRELSGKLSAEEIDAEAVRRADKAVRETFGSGEVKDQPAVVKGKFLSQMLPFYSYTSLVLNQFIRAGYIAYDRKDFVPLLRTTLFWYVLGSFAEAAFREAFARASGDDKDDYWQRVMLSLAGGGPIGGIPIARDLVPWAAAKAMGMYQGDGKSDVAAMAVFEQISQAYSDLLSDKKTWLDVGRDVTRVTNRIYRGSDTVTDGFWSLLKLLTMDTEKTGMEVIASLALDKDVIQRKEKKND